MVIPAQRRYWEAVNNRQFAQFGKTLPLPSGNSKYPPVTPVDCTSHVYDHKPRVNTSDKGSSSKVVIAPPRTTLVVVEAYCHSDGEKTPPPPRSSCTSRSSSQPHGYKPLSPWASTPDINAYHLPTTNHHHADAHVTTIGDPNSIDSITSGGGEMTHMLIPTLTMEVLLGK